VIEITDVVCADRRNGTRAEAHDQSMNALINAIEAELHQSQRPERPTVTWFEAVALCRKA
jgi:hypothetical protein